ncbi:hypothetical protein BaRGS_00037856, partial [Batillaria attramentaria]
PQIHTSSYILTPHDTCAHVSVKNKTRQGQANEVLLPGKDNQFGANASLPLNPPRPQKLPKKAGEGQRTPEQPPCISCPTQSPCFTCSSDPRTRSNEVIKAESRVPLVLEPADLEARSPSSSNYFISLQTGGGYQVPPPAVLPVILEIYNPTTILARGACAHAHET